MISGVPMDPKATGDGIGQQTDARGIERRKSETGEHRRGHRHGRSESRRAFDERPESEGDQQAPANADRR